MDVDRIIGCMIWKLASGFLLIVAGCSQSPYSSLVGKCSCVESVSPALISIGNCGILESATDAGVTIRWGDQRTVYPVDKIKYVQEISPDSPSGKAWCRG